MIFQVFRMQVENEQPDRVLRDGGLAGRWVTPRGWARLFVSTAHRRIFAAVTLHLNVKRSNKTASG